MAHHPPYIRDVLDEFADMTLADIAVEVFELREEAENLRKDREALEADLKEVERERDDLEAQLASERASA